MAKRARDEEYGPCRSAARRPRSSPHHGFFLLPFSFFLRRQRGLTLIEVLVTITLFLFLAAMVMMLVRQTTRTWTRNERDRVAYERATGALDRMSQDLALALGAEPPGVDPVLVRFIGDIDAKSGYPRVMFVRSFEAGPERALTLKAGDGKPTELGLRPQVDGAKGAPRWGGDGDIYTGNKLGDYKALGGMAQVAYFVLDQKLYRAIRAPVGVTFQELLDPAIATPLIEDVLFFDIDYWSQFSSSWDAPATAGRARGAEKVWDSTRGIATDTLRRFVMHRGAETLNDPEDDVFPQKVRLTLCVDSPFPRCLFTRLVEGIGGGDARVYVDSTRGFPAGGDAESYVLVDREWMRFRKRDDDAFIVDQRGARGTLAVEHSANAVVRAGKTFSRTVYLHQYREDWTSDKEYEARRRARQP